MENGMKKKLIARSQYTNQDRQKIIRLCFDRKSIEKFSPGLKMIFALDDPPIFVKLEEVEWGKHGDLGTFG